MASLEELVATFNALPREPQYVSESGFENHWHICLSVLSYEPKHPVVFLVNQEASPKYIGMPFSGETNTTTEKQVERIITILLKTFVGTWPTLYNKATAPWSWGTTHTGYFAQGLQQKLEAVGVRRELCVLRSSDRDCYTIQQTYWEMWQEKYRETLAIAKARRLLCFKCSLPIKQRVVCLKCKKASYCSRTCGFAHQIQHAPTCNSLALGLVSLPSDPFQYFKTIAPTILKAQTLATEIGLAFPNGNTPKGLRYLIRRLVVTGKDTPDNLATLLGKDYESPEIKNITKSMRLEVLLRPRNGSPAFALATDLRWDEDCPAWTPRPPSAEEVVLLSRIREMKATILALAGPIPVRDVPYEQILTDVETHFRGSMMEPIVFPVFLLTWASMDHGVKAMRDDHRYFRLVATRVTGRVFHR